LKLSIVDIALFDMLDVQTHLHTEILDNFPELKAFKEKIAALPEINAYLNSSRRKVYFCSCFNSPLGRRR
jgi:hypothetical protein